MTTSPQSPLKVSPLSAHIEMGVTELLVKSLAKQKKFYVDQVGLEILKESATSALLGHGKQAVLHLTQSETLSPASLQAAGLYHIAILFEQRSALAQALIRIFNDDPERYQGSADHLVSEAFYFLDPEGNGVELYYDKDPNTWQWIDGQVVMGSVYIDVQEYVEKYALHQASRSAKMGHVHLKVGSIFEARNFYVDTLGFHPTAELPTALFVSDGKYHHHLGMNVWESRGAGKREPSLGLKSVKMLLAEADDVQRLKARLTDSAVKYSQDENGVRVFDPWGNELLFESLIR